MNKLAERLEEIGKELAAIMITRGGNIKKSNKNKNKNIGLQTREDGESHLIVHKYYETTDRITDQLNIPASSSFPISSIGQKIIPSTYSLRVFLLLEAGDFFFPSSSSHAPAPHAVRFSFFARQNAIAVAVGDDFNQVINYFLVSFSINIFQLIFINYSYSKNFLLLIFRSTRTQ